MVRIATYYEHKSNAELMSVAGELMFRGYVVASGTLARSSLEAHLRRLCDWHTTLEDVGKQRPVGMMIGRLVDKHIFDQRTGAMLRKAFKVGSRCVHGRPVAYTDVAYLLDQVRLLLTTHPVDEEQADFYWNMVENESKNGGDRCKDD